MFIIISLIIFFDFSRAARSQIRDMSFATPSTNYLTLVKVYV